MLPVPSEQQLPLTMANQWPQTPSEEDWLSHKSEITLLYRDEKKTLAQVRDTMLSEYAFKASLQMYKRRIKQWGLEKRNKEHEVLEILRQRHRRTTMGKKTTFILRGQVVDMKNVHRYLKRKGISPEQINEMCKHPDLSRSHQFKEVINLICRTPSPTPVVVDPSVVWDEREAFYVSFDQYLRGSVESGAWTIHRGRLIPKGWIHQGDWFSCVCHIQDGTSRFVSGKYRSAMLQWRAGFVMLENVVKSWDYNVLQELGVVVGSVASVNVHITTMLLHHLRDLVKMSLLANEAQRGVLWYLAHLPIEEFSTIGDFMAKCSYAVFETLFGEESDFLLAEQVSNAWKQSLTRKWIFDQEIFDRAVARIQFSPNPSEIPHSALRRFAFTLSRSSYHEHAEVLLMLHLNKCRTHPDDDSMYELIFRTLIELGVVQKRTGRLDVARNTLLEARDVFDELSFTCQQDNIYHVVNILLQLVQMETLMSLDDDAAEHAATLANLQRILDRHAQNRLVEMNPL